MVESFFLFFFLGASNGSEAHFTSFKTLPASSQLPCRARRRGADRRGPRRTALTRRRGASRCRRWRALKNRNRRLAKGGFSLSSFLLSISLRVSLSLFFCTTLLRSRKRERSTWLEEAQESASGLIEFPEWGRKKGSERERERECIEAREKQSKKTEMQRSSPFFLPLSFISLFDDLGRSNGGRCRFSARSKRQQQQPLPPPARRGARGPRWSMLGYRLEPRR